MGVLDPQASSADVVRDVYVQYRRRTEANYWPNSKQNEHFVKAAQLCTVLGADPRTFVEAQFIVGGWGQRGNIPWPSQLHSQQAESNYRTYYEDRESFTPPAEELFRKQMEYLARILNQGVLTLDEALVHQSSKGFFTPLFRLIVCSMEAFPIFEKYFAEAARADLLANPDLHQFLLQQYEYRTERILRTGVSGSHAGACSPAPPPAPFGLERQI